MIYGIKTILLTDIGTKLVSKIFWSLYDFSGIKNLMKNAHHLHTSGQTERYNKKLGFNPRNYVGEHHMEWEE